MSKVLDVLGTSVNSFLVAIGGVRLKNSSGNLLIRNAGDTADAEVTTSKVNVSGNDIVLNSDAAGSGSDYTITLRRPNSGMTAAYTLTLPVDDGSPAQILQTDGNGNTAWVSVAGTADKVTCDTTTLSFGSSATVSMFTLPTLAVVLCVRVTVDIAFSGNPSMSVGISGNPSKYLASTQVDLSMAGTTVFEVYPGRAAVATPEVLQVSYSAGGATTGLARVEVEYAVPS